MEPVNALAYAERQLAVAEARAESWRRIVEGLAGLNGEAPMFVRPDPHESADEPDTANVTIRVTHVQPERPKGMTAVRQLVSERPGRWTLAQFHDEFDKRGWRHTDDKRKFHAAVDSAVYRLCDLGEGVKLAPGTFRFPAPEQQGVLAA